MGSFKCGTLILGDGEVNRVEFINFYVGRYTDSMAVANLEFEAADINNDGVFSFDDWKEMYEG